MSKWVALLCLWLMPGHRGLAQFVEISAEIEMTSWSGETTNGPTGAKPQPQRFSLVCTTGTHQWRIENDISPYAEEKWLFDGTNVYKSVRVTNPIPEERMEKIARTSKLALVPFERAKSNLTLNIWPSRDGHPLGDHGINLPWLAFCSGTYLEHKGRLVPLPGDPSPHP